MYFCGKFIDFEQVVLILLKYIDFLESIKILRKYGRFSEGILVKYMEFLQSIFTKDIDFEKVHRFRKVCRF